MCPVSCTNTHHDATGLINHGMVLGFSNLNSGSKYETCFQKYAI